MPVREGCSYFADRFDALIPIDGIDEKTASIIKLNQNILAALTKCKEDTGAAAECQQLCFSQDNDDSKTCFEGGTAWDFVRDIGNFLKDYLPDCP